MSTEARQRAREVQRRLLAVDRGVPLALAAAVGAGALAAGLVIVQAWVVAGVVSDAVAGRAPLAGTMAVLGVALVGRALLGAMTELAGRWGARRAMAVLRTQLTAKALRGRASPISGARRGEVITAATHGVDALADYYARAVPAVALAGAVPVAMVAVIGWRAPLIGALLAITLPIVVVFMVLVGVRSAEHARDRQTALAVLGAHFLEVVRGLPTLRAHGREGAQLPTLWAISGRYRDESLAALRIAFLSALVLEVLAMLGTAIAAAVVGVLLAEGRLGLEVGLFVLLLAPEVYAPLRDAGQRFHAAEDGTEAARRLLASLDEPDPLAPLAPSPSDPSSERASRSRVGLELASVAVRGGEGRLDALSTVDLLITDGEHVAVVGPSGAGKSTLLSLLARLRDPDQGAVLHEGVDLRGVEPERWWRTIAWLPQRPELPAGTLRAVLQAAAGAAGTVDDPQEADGAVDARLEQALARADAGRVVAELPDGLDTRVGPGGRQLSAGQAQRLCLAGALASRAPMLLLDEPTAHLDDASAARVRAGILEAASGRTLVVATHDEALATACGRRVGLTAVGADPAAAVPPWPSAAAAVAAGGAGVAVPPPGATADADLSAGSGPLRPGRPLALGVLSALAGMAVLAVSGWLIVRAAEQPPVLALLSTIVIVRALGLVRALARYAERLSGHDQTLRRLADRRVAWYGRLADRIGAPDLPPAANLLTRFTADVDALQDRDLRVRQPVAVAAVVAVVAVVVAGLLLPAAGAVLLAASIVGGLLGPLIAWASGRRAAARQAPARARLGDQLDEVLRLGPALTLGGLADSRRVALHRAAASLGRADRSQAWAASVGGAVTALSSGGGLVAVLFLAATATADGVLAPVALGAVVFLTVGLQEVLRPLPEAALRLVSVQLAEQRLAEVIDGPPALDAAPSAPSPLPSSGTFSAAGLRHRAGGPQGPLVLEGAALTVRPGERVAIVGPSGAGKSTLLQLLGRLADPQHGAVSFAGIDLRQASVSAVREHVRLAGQDAHLLAGTLAANLRIGGPDATDAELREVLDAVGLGSWSRALPSGLQTLVGEEGSAVSGGQRQRVGVARALLSPASVLLLDEPTAMLDAETAATLLDDVVDAAAGRTLIVVTHDGDRLNRFDRILHLRGGRLSERPGGPSAARASA